MQWWFLSLVVSCYDFCRLLIKRSGKELYCKFYIECRFHSKHGDFQKKRNLGKCEISAESLVSICSVSLQGEEDKNIYFSLTSLLQDQFL